MTQTTSQGTHREMAVGGSKRTRQGMRIGVQKLEKALARATPTRETPWRDDVLKQLTELESVMTAQAAELRSEDGLLADLLLQHPRLARQIAELRDAYDRLVANIRELREKFATERISQISSNVAEMRRRLAKLIEDVRDFQATETDLIYEAIQVDIGVGD